MEQLKEEIKLKLIEALNLEDITPEEIDSTTALFGDGLGLDSIDALEIILILEKSYGIRLENPAGAKEIFFSIDTLADYISKNRKQ
jgi:acyl carrier protein